MCVFLSGKRDLFPEGRHSAPVACMMKRSLPGVQDVQKPGREARLEDQSAKYPETALPAPHTQEERSENHKLMIKQGN